MAALFAELKRRNVIRMAGLYLVVAWLIVQVTGTVLPMFGAPDWLPRTIVLLLAIGLLPVLIFAWAYELTPDGIKRDAEVSPEQSIAGHTAKRMNRLLAAMLMLALVYFGVEKFVLAPKREAAAVSAASVKVKAQTLAGMETPVSDKSIAVLPFVNMSADKDNEYFSDGISEEILNALAKVDDLKVAGRTSSFFFKGKNESLTTIGETLRVAHLLEGSVRKQGEKVRITAQLIRASDGFHLWSETYDGDLKDVFALQESIAQAIAGKLQVILQGQQKSRLVNAGTANAEAYQFYLQGRYHWNKRDTKEFEKAVAFFKQAIAKDPNYALAYSGLADTYSLFPNYGDFRRKDYMPQAKAAALKALELDPNLAEAHASLGEAIFYYEYDWAGAEKAFKRAIELNPKYATAHQWYAELLSNSGKHDEAIKEATTALGLDPFSMIINRDLTGTFLFAKRYDDALAQSRKTNELFPDEAAFHAQNGTIYEAQGKFEKAVEEYLLAIKAAKRVTAEDVKKFEAAYAKDGWAGFAKLAQGFVIASLDNKQAKDKNGYVRAFDYAIAYARVRDKDKTIEYLNKAYDERSHRILQLNVYFAWDFLRDDPRFIELVKKVGIPE